VTAPPAGENPRYVFSYQVRIVNLSDVSVQLRSRRWLIVDADGERHEVVGEGVIGQQPRLDPGVEFEYESFCPLPTAWGTMEGEFRMEVRTGPRQGEMIEVRVERFYLAAC
jgi:ApaG protein